ncbi:MAG: VOC family protein [Negativicutes bacterium]|nr:VOC family protein [Negativicutes bacterium]
MGNIIRYVHTNIIARDWKKLVRFYIDVFHCTPIYPERKLQGEWLSKITGIDNVKIEGMHLALPGFENGPTLEVFSYTPAEPADTLPPINRQGLGHLAFHVDSVEAVLTTLLANGGEPLGDLIVRDYGELGTLTAVYARDPEGNIIEIQNWQK